MENINGLSSSLNKLIDDFEDKKIEFEEFFVGFLNENCFPKNSFKKKIAFIETKEKNALRKLEIRITNMVISLNRKIERGVESGEIISTLEPVWISEKKKSVFKEWTNDILTEIKSYVFVESKSRGSFLEVCIDSKFNPEKIGAEFEIDMKISVI